LSDTELVKMVTSSLYRRGWHCHTGKIESYTFIISQVRKESK